MQWYRDNMQWTNNVRSGEYLKYYSANMENERAAGVLPPLHD